MAFYAYPEGSKLSIKHGFDYAGFLAPKTIKLFGYLIVPGEGYSRI